MRVLLAAIQCEKGAPETNLSSHRELAGKAAASGCGLALSPEMSLTGSVDPSAHPEHLVSLDHPAVAELARSSARAGVGLCFEIAELSNGEAHIAQVFIADGHVAGVQKKASSRARRGGLSGGVFYSDIRSRWRQLRRGHLCRRGFDAPFDSAVARGARLVLVPAAPGLHGPRGDIASWQEGFSWWEASSLGDAPRHARRLGIWIAQAGQAGRALMRTCPAWQHSSAPMGTSFPGCSTGTRASSLSTYRSRRAARASD
ncbi:MAG: nitrilase-related carbon-nitrogen hydrolase [Acidimicrobiales bacterium]